MLARVTIIIHSTLLLTLYTGNVKRDILSRDKYIIKSKVRIARAAILLLLKGKGNSDRAGNRRIIEMRACDLRNWNKTNYKTAFVYDTETNIKLH